MGKIEIAASRIILIFFGNILVHWNDDRYAAVIDICNRSLTSSSFLIDTIPLISIILLSSPGE